MSKCSEGRNFFASVRIYLFDLVETFKHYLTTLGPSGTDS
jgi:hypothetical protein